MLLVRSDAIEAMAREQFTSTFEQQFGRAPTDGDIEELYVSPLDGYQMQVVSGLSAIELERLAIANELPLWEFAERSDIVQAPREQVVRWSFRYLQFVGYVCLVISLLSVFLYARGRKDARRHADRVGRTIGITKPVTVKAALVEYALLGVVALVPALIASVAVAGRIGPLFDRGPFPPRLELSLPVAEITALAGVSLALVVLTGVVVEWSETAGGARDERS